MEDINYTVKEYPFKHLIIKDFLDLELLKKINDYFVRVPETLYVKESVPQSVMTNLNINELNADDEIEIRCISAFDEKNKILENANMKKIRIETKPNGQQGINRLFIDKNNIKSFPEIELLKKKLCSKEDCKICLNKSFASYTEETSSNKLKM